ncbi:hypothetical protein KDY119_01446 [Luteimicrobium xylanilyticum]|uniref:Peptidase inhibitor family I36 n=2 Tax=Luteimicrobium xylanilyticum TaxID=1133546 RepID=A0A5P9Q9Y4_9MICO|nr:hypothetical protein KDY119_01446 [Luteimicrobium xylanilyticum]
MGISKKAVALAVAFVGMLLAGIGAAVPAQAAADCNVGYTCLWMEDNSSGTYIGKSADYDSLVGTKLNDTASSAEANGGSCSSTYYYDTSTRSGAYFYLNSKSLVTANYQDPNLTNGAGKGTNAGENWDNRISSYKFSGCSS